jgi:hypothetical protein
MAARHLGPGQGQAEQGDKSHAQQQEQEMTKAQSTLIRAMLLQKETKSGKNQALGLLLHQQVQQYRDANQGQAAQK